MSTLSPDPPSQWRLDHEVTETVEGEAVETPTTLAIIGAGRAGSALATALTAAGHPVLAVHSRTAAHAARLAAAVGAAVVDTPAEAISRADITLATVPDGEITHVAVDVAGSGRDLSGRALVHCSATYGRDALAAAEVTGVEAGAFHPLQALAGAASAPSLRGSSFVIDAAGPLMTRLEMLAHDLGGHLLELPASERALYHAAAVLVGNAPLALLARATTLLTRAGVDEESAHRALASLMVGAATNAAAAGPASALTGPVVRGDAATVARHLDVLSAEPSTRELYRRLALEMLSLAGPENREAVAEVLTATSARRGRGASRVVAHPRVA